MTDNKKMLLYFQLGARSFAKGTSNKEASLFSNAINLENINEFNSSNNLEVDEWFFINLSSKKQGKKIIATFKGLIDNSVNTITKEDYAKTKSIFIRRDNLLIFQRIYPRQRMNNLVLRIFERDSLNIDKIQGLTVSQLTTDAILNFEEKKLYFQHYSKIKQIFTGIEDYYRIATDEEIKKFREKFSSVVEIEGSVLSKLGDRNKKNIAALMDDQKLVKKIKAKSFTDWKEYAERYQCVFSLNNKGDGFKCDSNKDLTDILKIILEKYYEGEVTKTRKEAL